MTSDEVKKVDNPGEKAGYFCEEVTTAIKRFYAKVLNKDNASIFCIFPSIDDKWEEFNKYINDNGTQDKKIIIFFSLFDKESHEYLEYYKNWLFVIEHYATVVKVPVDVAELRRIEPKSFLKPGDVKGIYNKVKTFMSAKSKENG